MSFPEQPFGFVAGRWVLSIGDTPDDSDRAPDYVPVKDAMVVFTPQVTHRVAADGSGWAGIIKDRVSARLGERGQLIDAEGHDHLALAVGIYSVSYNFGLGRSWPSHYIEVKPEHTADAPLWLPPIAPPPKGPMIENRVITIPADGQDGQVLVWDGAGFSWDYNPGGVPGPRGPQGPAIDIDTGLPIQVDTTVGTRVFIGGQMVYGDTGWRDITSLLHEEWEIARSAGTFQIVRHNNTVTLACRIQRKPDAPPRWLGQAVPLLNTENSSLPNGFIPLRIYSQYSTLNVLSKYVGELVGNTYGDELRIRARSAPNDVMWTAGDILGFQTSWDTSNSWPVVLPGLPA